MSESGKETGRFGHHPDPAIDYCVEVEEIEAIWTDRCNKFANPDDASLESRVQRAMMFKVGGDLHAINAKDRVRNIDADLVDDEIARITQLQVHGPAFHNTLRELNTLAYLALQMPEQISAQHLFNVTQAALLLASNTEGGKNE